MRPLTLALALLVVGLPHFTARGNDRSTEKPPPEAQPRLFITFLVDRASVMRNEKGYRADLVSQWLSALHAAIAPKSPLAMPLLQRHRDHTFIRVVGFYSHNWEEGKPQSGKQTCEDISTREKWGIPSPDNKKNWPPLIEAFGAGIPSTLSYKGAGFLPLDEWWKQWTEEADVIRPACKKAGDCKKIENTKDKNEDGTKSPLPAIMKLVLSKQPLDVPQRRTCDKNLVVLVTDGEFDCTEKRETCDYLKDPASKIVQSFLDGGSTRQGAVLLIGPNNKSENCWRDAAGKANSKIELFKKMSTSKEKQTYALKVLKGWLEPLFQETCNGCDDDVNGQTDETEHPRPPCDLQAGVCAGSKRRCAMDTDGLLIYPDCDNSDYGAQASSFEPEELSCDEVDNDCDGERDERPVCAKACPEPAQEPTVDVVAVGRSNQWHCSGVVVSKQAVLTARHCLPADAVLMGPSIDAATDLRRVVEVQFPDVPGMDVALLRLDRSVPAPRHKQRPSWYRSPPTSVLLHVGFGARDAQGHAGFGTQHALRLDAQGWGCTRERATKLGCDPLTEMVVPGSPGSDTCDGDSGGALFEFVLREPVCRQAEQSSLFGYEWHLLALTSRPIAAASVRCGQGGIYTRLDIIQGWLNRQLDAWERSH